MLRRQNLWIPVLQHNPLFGKGLEKFLFQNPVSTLVASKLKLSADNIFVALEADARKPGKQVARFMAVPFTVTEDICDTSQSISQTPTLSTGFATNVSDSLNSLQVMERLLPIMSVHVSICLNLHQQTPIRKGDEIVIISSIDKIGKRIAYCSTDFILDGATPESVALKEKNIQTFEDLKTVLAGYPKLMSGKHVKNILEKTKSDKEATAKAMG